MEKSKIAKGRTDVLCPVHLPFQRIPNAIYVSIYMGFLPLQLREKEKAFAHLCVAHGTAYPLASDNFYCNLLQKMSSTRVSLFKLPTTRVLQCNHKLQERAKWLTFLLFIDFSPWTIHQRTLFV